MHNQTTIDPIEVAKFADHATTWWDPNGPLKTLHDINPTRLQYVLNETPLCGQKVLDIGCGGGVFSEAMAEQGAFVTGIDVQSSVITIAEQHAVDRHLSIEYHCTPVEYFKPDCHAIYDVVTCMEMLEHVPDPAFVIEHVARLLKPGGMFFLSTINRTFKAYASVIIAAEYVFKLLPRQTHDYQKFIKPSEIARVLRKHHFEVTSIVGMDYNPFTREASLGSSVDCNYLLSCRKEAT